MALTVWELWACANKVLEQHGDGAADVAASRILDLERRGEDLGSATWGLILVKIAELRKTKPDGETVQ
jgi:hypothetical protein